MPPNIVKIEKQDYLNTYNDNQYTVHVYQNIGLDENGQYWMFKSEMYSKNFKNLFPGKVYGWQEIDKAAFDPRQIWGDLSQDSRDYLQEIVVSGRGHLEKIPPEELLLKKLVNPFGFGYVVDEKGWELYEGAMGKA